VFQIDVETFSACGGAATILACIEDPVMIKKITTHLKKKPAWRHRACCPKAAPPVSVFD